MNAEEGKIINLESFGVPARTDEGIDALTRTSDYLPQLLVYGASSDIVKEGKFPMGHFGLYFSQDNIVDLGEVIDCLVIDWRPRASILASGGQPLSWYGRLNSETNQWEYSDTFLNVKDRSMAKEKGFAAGLEYLFWIPSAEKFALFLMGNPTLRRESSNVKALTGGAVTLKVKFIKGSKYSWHGASAFKCTTPFDLPSEDAIKDEVLKFREPKDSEMELTDDSDSSRAR